MTNTTDALSSITNHTDTLNIWYKSKKWNGQICVNGRHVIVRGRDTFEELLEALLEDVKRHLAQQ